MKPAPHVQVEPEKQEGSTEVGYTGTLVHDGLKCAW